MANLAARRRARNQIDQNVARAAAPSIRRVLATEGRAVATATQGIDTLDAWIMAATGAVDDDAWIDVIVALWLSPGVRALWDDQQAELGTDYDLTAEARGIIVDYATGHGRLIAASRRRRLEAEARAGWDEADG